MTWNPEWVARLFPKPVRKAMRAQALGNEVTPARILAAAAGRPVTTVTARDRVPVALPSPVTSVLPPRVPVAAPPVTSVQELISRGTYPTVPPLAEFIRRGQEFAQGRAGGTPGAPGGPAASSPAPPPGAPGGVPAPMPGMVPMFQYGQVTNRPPLYNQALAQRYGYTNVGGFNMAPQAANFAPTPMTVPQMEAAFGPADISGLALESGQTQRMNTAQALGTSLANLSPAQLGSPEVQALLAQLAAEAQFEQTYGVPMYQPQQYGSYLQ